MRKFFVSLAALLVAFFIQVKIFPAPFSLAALIASAFFLEFAEIILLIVLALLAFAWQPAMGPEFIVFAALPILAYGFKRIFSWSGWLTNIGFVFFGSLALYAAGSFVIVRADPALTLRDAALALMFGVFAFFIEKEII